MRIKICSVEPPNQPDAIPTSVPNAAEPGTTIATTISEIRAPCIKRLKMSRPTSSVPSA